MLAIGKLTLVEKVKDVIFDTGLLSPRTSITLQQRFKEDYGLQGQGPVAAFTKRVNSQFAPYGISISVDEMSKCKTVNGLVNLLASKKPTQQRNLMSAPVMQEILDAKKSTSKRGKKQ